MAYRNSLLNRLNIVHGVKILTIIKIIIIIIKVQVPGPWAKGCVLNDCVGVILLDMTTPP